jgi:hypothetical protein
VLKLVKHRDKFTLPFTTTAGVETPAGNIVGDVEDGYYGKIRFTKRRCV